MTHQEARLIVRQSLGLPAKPEPVPTVPQEGHAAEFPYWSFSKKRSSVTQLHIDYEDGSFMTLLAPLGMPSPSFCGYLDVILFYGQRDLFVREYVEISVYKIMQTLDLDPTNGRAYAHFHRDMDRAFAAFIKTDRFRDPITGKRDYVDYFRILRRMRLAKRRESVSKFYFDEVFLASLRAGYLNRLDWNFHIPPNLVVGRCWRTLIASRSEDLQVEHPVRCRDATAFHFHPTLPGMLGASLIRHQVVQVG